MSNFFTLDLDRRNFLLLCGIGSLTLFTFPLRFRVVLVDPCIITCDCTAQNIILPLQKVLANCDFFFGFDLRWALLGPFLQTHSSCQDLQLRVSCFSVDVHLLCYASNSRRFSRTIWRIFAMFSWDLLVAGRPDLSSSVTLSLPSEKRVTHLETAVFFTALAP